MKRLTEKDWKDKCEGYPWNVHPVKDIDDLPYYKKLASYEDDEEQGLLLRLPCKIGDTLYRVNKGAKEPVIMMRVIQLYIKQIHKDRTVMRIDAINDADMGESCYLPCNIGERIFLTRAEAEAKLKSDLNWNLSSFYAWATAEEIIQKNPILRVQKIKKQKVRKEALTEMEIERLRMAADGEMQKMMIEVLLSTGCRVTELAVQVYLAKRRDENPYLLPGAKSMRERKGMDRKVSRKNWWMDRNNLTEGHITTSTVESMMRTIEDRAEVEQANPHKFRRTCATFALRRGMPIEQVSRMLGHEEVGTTQIYLDLKEEDLKRSHEKYVV